MSFNVPNRYRVRKGFMASDDSVGNCGAQIPTPPSWMVGNTELGVLV